MELPREPHTRGAGAAGRAEGGAARRSHYGLPAWNQPPGLCHRRTCNGRRGRLCATASGRDIRRQPFWLMRSSSVLWLLRVPSASASATRQGNWFQHTLWVPDDRVTGSSTEMSQGNKEKDGRGGGTREACESLCSDQAFRDGSSGFLTTGQLVPAHSVGS